MGLFDNLFGKRHNVERGKDVEDEFRSNSEIQGYEVDRTGIGSDHKRSRRDLLTGKKSRSEYWDSKRNDSPVSERQKQTRGLKIYRRYDPSPKRPFGETRVEDKYRNELERDIFTGKYRKVPKRKSDPFGLNMGSSKPRRTKANDDPFGVGSMFGGSSGISRRRRRKDDPFGLF